MPSRADSIASRDCGRIRIEISACTPRPSRSKSTAAWNPVRTPRARSARVRSSAVDGAIPTASASSRLVCRPSRCNRRRIA